MVLGELLWGWVRFPREVSLELGLQVWGRSPGLGLRHTSPLCFPRSRACVALFQLILWAYSPSASAPAMTYREGWFDRMSPHLPAPWWLLNKHLHNSASQSLSSNH